MVGGGKDREEMKESEYYGWIFVEEKLPPLGEYVLIAYVEEAADGEKFVDYMVTNYDKYKVISTEEIRWFLPQYHKQSCVKAWRKLPPFPLN